MDEQYFKERLDFGLKIRLAGALCSAVCLIARAVFFAGSSVHPLFMLVPYAISAVMGFVKVMLVSFDADDDNESVIEAYDSAYRKFCTESAGLRTAVRIIGGADVVFSFVMIFCKW